MESYDYGKFGWVMDQNQLNSGNQRRVNGRLNWAVRVSDCDPLGVNELSTTELTARFYL
jgi:hypothetical protein